MRANADQEMVSMPCDALPEIIADETCIAAKQRIFRETLLLQQLQHMRPLTRIGGTRIPAPRQTRTDVPKQAQPHLLFHLFRIVMAFLACCRTLTPRVASAFLVAPFFLLALPARFAETFFIRLGTWHVQTRAIHG